MTSLTTYLTLKKSYLYNFFPVKADESRHVSSPERILRSLVEIRDVHPPPHFDPRQPWRIRKSMTHTEAVSSKIMISFEDTFNHIIRYWRVCMAQHLSMWGSKVSVVVWDFTNEKRPRKYQGADTYFQMTPSGHCVLSCDNLMRVRGAKANDGVGVYWESREEYFCIKLFCASGGGGGGR